jgi:hypothetical protein
MKRRQRTLPADYAGKQSTMTRTKVSIALCTFNGAHFLAEQLASYAAQETPPDEIVACDDGSTDGTLAVLGNFAATAPFPVHVHVNEARLGVAANFSKAIGLCLGDVVALSDQDDVWRADKLRRIVAELDRCPNIGMVFTDAVAIDERGTSIGYRLWEAVLFTSAEQRMADQGYLLEVLLRHYVVTGATLAFRAKYRDLLLPIPPNALHDAWIALLIAAISGGSALAEPLIGYRQHATQTSGGERVLGLAAQAGRARQQTEDVLEGTAARFELVHERLQASRYRPSAAHAIDLIDGKVRHLRARARMRRAGTFRLPLIAREALAGRYARYSHAWKGIAADLFLK